MSGENEPGESHLSLYALIALMTVLWSINYIIGKIALREFPAMLAAGLRTALAGIIMAPIYMWGKGQASHRKWTRSDVPLLLCLGLFGVALNQLFFVMGLSRTSVAHAALMIGLTPILVLIISYVVGLERINGFRLLGMLLALAGVIVLQSGGGKGNSATAAGDVLVFLGALTFAMFTVLSKRNSGRFDNITINAFGYIGGGLMLLPLTIFGLATFPVQSVSIAAWLSLLYMALFSSVVCYLIFYYALTKIPASRVSTFSYLQPLIATALAIPILGEQPTPSLFLGGGLVLAGVYVTERV